VRVAGISLGPELLVLPKWVVIHHLFARASRELRAPHEEAALNTTLYLEWMSSAKPAAVAELIRPALAAYERKYGAHGSAEAAAQAQSDEVSSSRAVARMVRLLCEEWMREV